MDKLENKKYSVLLFLTGFFGIILGSILAHNYYWINGTFCPVEYFYQSYNVKFEIVKGIDFGFFVIGLKQLSSFLVLIIACSVYLFLYKTDEEIRGYLIEIKRRVQSKNILGVVSNMINNIPATLGLKTSPKETIIKDYVKSEESIKYNKIMDAKSTAAIYGLIFGAIQLGIFVMSRNLYWEDSTKIIINFSIVLLLRIFSAYKCYMLSEYNMGSSWFWFLFGVLMPSVALILAGMPFMLNKETNALSDSIRKQKNL
jgi:hypothetical protein